MSEQDEKITHFYNGAYSSVSGGGASLNQYYFSLFKNERMVIYFCITLIAIFYIVYNSP